MIALNSLFRLIATIILPLLISSLAFAQTGKQGAQPDWEKTLTAAKKEGRIVVSIPASAELRTELETGFKSKYPGIELELNAGRGSANINKIVEEHRAGVRSFDIHIGGTTSIITGLLANQLLEPVLPSLLLPEVRDEKNWWGGHIWADIAKKHIYLFSAYMTETIWHNTNLIKAEEITSWDKLLDPKLKGKIAILDPRTPGAGESTWAFLWRIKGEEYLAKLVAQEMMVGRNQRQLAEAVARGKSAVSIGLSYYTYAPFIKAGLPVNSISQVKEGYYASSGSGNVVLLNNAPHPNAAKVFVNWLLAKDGQAIFSKTMGQPTRRLDVDTRYTREFGHVAAKEFLTPAKYDELENGSEEVVIKYRKPAMEIAEKLIK